MPDYMRDPHNDWGDDYALPFKPPTSFVDDFDFIDMTYDEINQAAAEKEADDYAATYMLGASPGPFPITYVLGVDQEPPILEADQDSLIAAIKALSLLHWVPTLVIEHDDERVVGYDGFGAPLHAHQLDPEGAAADWRNPAPITVVDWRDPEPITLTADNVTLETLEIVIGAPLVPLHNRRIDSKGTE